MKITWNNRKSTGKATMLLTLQALLISNVLFPSIAFAYVDPGSGSVIVTTILGLIAAIGYTCRKYFYKIKRTLTGKKPAEEENSSE